MRYNLTEKQLVNRIKGISILFMLALIASGITAFPIEKELEILSSILSIDINNPNLDYNILQRWLCDVYVGISSTYTQYPFIAYGTDWLAFAHIIIAIAFVGVYFKPVRNIWIVYWATIACILLIPTAIICGTIREIPTFWIFIDCSFGIIGIVPLIILIRYINELARISGCYIPTKY